MLMISAGMITEMVCENLRDIALFEAHSLYKSICQDENLPIPHEDTFYVGLGDEQDRVAARSPDDSSTVNAAPVRNKANKKITRRQVASNMTQVGLMLHRLNPSSRRPLLQVEMS